MKTFINELTTNSDVISFFFVPELPQIRQSKKKSDYMCLKLQDKTGIVEGRVWEYPLGFDPNTIKKGTFIKIRGQVGEWNDVQQVAITQIRLVEESDGVDLGDFFERSERDPETMMDELERLLLINVSDPFILELLQKMVSSNKKNLLQAPAAKSVHHAYIGGLLTHILSMCQFAIPTCQHYGLNVSLVLAGCVLHDFGKTIELTYPIGIGYSLPGNLLGHIVIGLEIAAKTMDTISDFPTPTKIAVLHLIASHHSLLAYGSPKVPLMKEALALHVIDSIDAKLAICDRAFKKGIDAEGLTEFVRELEGPLWKGPEDV